MIYTLFKKIFTVIIFFFFSIYKSLYHQILFIILKIDNEIITSLDLESEYKYLTALNKI